MRYRLIALDMDGTLLNNSRQITERTCAAIRAVGERGGYVCLSTGRPLCGVRKYLEQLELVSPVIACNGALVVDPAADRVIHSQCMLPEDAWAVWNFAHRVGTTVCVWVQDKLYVNEINERTEDYKGISGVEPEKIYDFDVVVKKGISKMLWYDTPENIAEWRTGLDAELGGRVSYLTSNPRFLEFTHLHASKATALERLGEFLGVPREEIMAIGDGENDLPMLRYAGLSVAMGNASDAVCSQCMHVTASNQEDGVALALERFCLNDLQ